MRGALLSIVLMIIAAVMMGCTGDIIPCTEGGEECAIDTGGFDLPIPMVCDMTVTAQQKCEDMYGWMDELPFPIEIPFPLPIPDCSDLDAYPDTGGVCEIDFPDHPF